MVPQYFPQLRRLEPAWFFFFGGLGIKARLATKGQLEAQKTPTPAGSGGVRGCSAQVDCDQDWVEKYGGQTRGNVGQTVAAKMLLVSPVVEEGQGKIITRGVQL